MKYACIIILAIVVTITAIFFNNNTQPVAKSDNTFLVKNGSGPGIDLYIPKNPKRVIFLNSSSLDLWLGAGGADKVCAYVKFATLPERIYGQLGAQTVILGSNLNISPEQIVAQKPDLVVTNSTNSIQTKLGDVLKQFNIALLTIHNQSVEDTYFELELYGKLTGKPELATKQITRIKTNIQKIKSSYQGKKRPKAVLILGTTSSFSMLLPNARQSSFLELAGGQNIAVQPLASGVYYLPLSLEYVAQQEPDYIFFISMGPEQKILSSLKKEFKENAAWQSLQAVKNDKVHVLPTELFSAHYGLQVDKAVEHINKILYPN